MKGAVLVSTHDLPLAGVLRSAFTDAGFPVELVTAPEDLPRFGDPVLLVVTSLASEEGRRLAEAGQVGMGLPVFGIFPDSWEGEWRSVARELELSEVFTGAPDPGDLLLLGRRVIQRRHLQEVTGIVGETDAMREVLERVIQIAPVDSTVLVTGESGTGKELVARGLHALSPRKHRAFIAVNVAALPDTLLESELFGHEKGAFTGAIDSRRGLFELADRGTIFLDEIGEMPLATQTKLLRVLEQREFLRVGGEKPIRVDLRVITATNQDLRQLVAVGDFRRDLYYRLNVLRIELPPLRNRREDIPRLVHRFVGEVSQRLDRSFEGISSEAMEILMDHHWPGNVRELRNLVESMVVLAPGRVIRPVDIPDEVRNPSALRSMVPVPIPRGGGGVQAGEGVLRPELEFLFRTMVDLRLDVDQLRREFDRYRREREAGEKQEVELGFLRLDGGERLLPGPSSVAFPSPAPEPEGGGEAEGEVSGGSGSPPGAGGESAPGVAPPEPLLEGVVVYRPGMTMDDLEREAIVAALREVEGNRRRAAEQLGIGERTLYRKIRKFGLEE